MADRTPSVSVTGYLGGLAAALVLGTLAYLFVLAPLLFGNGAFVQDTTPPDSQMRTLGPGLTLPTVLGIAFVAIVAVAHGWLYVNYPRLLDDLDR